MGILFGMFSMLGWGITDFLGAKSSRKIGYLLALLWMQIIGFLFAFVYFLVNFQNFDLNKITGSLIILIFIAILETVAYVFFYKGLKEGQVSLVAPIGSASAMVTIILGIVFLKETLFNSQIAAIILIIAGTLLVSFKLEELIKNKKLSISKGIKEGLVAMVLWGFVGFFLVYPSKILGWFLPVVIIRVFTIIILILYLASKKESIRINPQPSLLFLLIPIGLLDVGSFFAFMRGISSEYVSIISPIAAASPLISILLARIFLKEKLAPNQILGISSVITGLILISL